MGSETFESTVWVPYPVELVFAFFANPSNLLHLTPPELRMRLESLQIVPPALRPQAEDPGRRFHSLAAGIGSELDLSFRFFPRLPLRMHWTARIVEFAWHSHFADEQIRGPFARFRHRHGFAAERRSGTEGTLVLDHVEFALPGGAVGALLLGPVGRQLERQFAWRRQRLEPVLGAVARQARQQR